MSTLYKLFTDVQNLIVRTDLTFYPIIQREITAAIMSAHGSADFDQDLVLTPFATFNHATAQGNFTDNLPARFRKVHKVVTTSSDGTKFDNFKRRYSEELGDYFGFVSPDTYRVVGSTVNVVYSSSPTALSLLYYALPTVAWDLGNVTASTTTSWIVANDATEDVVRLRATAHLFTALGQEKDAQLYSGLYRDALNRFIQDYGMEI